MAKDPAFLFYANDFLTGTLTMTDEQVGKYIRLLCLQHQKNELSEKDMLFICKSHDEDIFAKFKNVDGKYFNERLREESIKRVKYSESRRNNKLKKNISSSYVKHMENENENENEDINENNINKVKKIKIPNLNEVIEKFISYEGTEEMAEKYFATNEARGWIHNDAPIVNWMAMVPLYIKAWKAKENKENDAIEKEKQNNIDRWNRERAKMGLPPLERFKPNKS